MRRILIVIGPSGIGKSFLAQELLRRSPDKFVQGRLYTTRTPRPGEDMPDRIFVSQEKFEAKRQAGDFFIAERFHDNWYGYPNEWLDDEDDRCIVANAWPALVPRFESLEAVTLVGLSVNGDDGLKLLEHRMSDRGYSDDVMQQRLTLVRQDVTDIAEHADTIAAHGRLFTINDDSAIPDKVIPWILANV